jgi:hypothetical protein
MQHCGPHFRPIAKPSRPQHYVLPCSENLDPPYSWWRSKTWPYPRMPWAFESETRAKGTGLIWGCADPCPPRPCAPPKKCCHHHHCRPKHWWGAYFPKWKCCC